MTCISQDTSYPTLIAVRNYGAYIAKFSVSYTNEGKEKFIETEYFLAGEERRLIVPAYSSNIRLKVENMIFILIWKSVYESQIVPWSDFCLVIGGTTLDPSAGFC